MEKPARDTLQQHFTDVTESSLNPGWLARELFQAGIIDKACLQNAENEIFGKQKRLTELLLAVRGHGRPRVFQQFVEILKNSDTHSYLGEDLIVTYTSKGGQLTVTQPQELAGPINTGLAKEASSSAAVPEYYHYQSTVSSHTQPEHQSRPGPYSEGDYTDVPLDSESESLLQMQARPEQASSSGSKIPLTSPPVNPTAMDRPSIAHFSSPAGVSQVNSPENLLVGSTVDPPVNEQPASLVPGVQPSGAGDMEVKSTEYQVFRNHFHELAMGITDPTMLGSMLFSAELIDLDIQSKLPGTSLSSFEKNQMLLSAVGQQIRLNPTAAFATFLEVLESEPGCKDLAGTLNKTHSMMKSLSVSGSSSGTSMARAGNSALLQHSRSTDNRQPPSWTWDPTFHGATYQIGETRSPDQCSPAPLDEYAEYLRDYYSQMEMPRAISNWPQVPLQKYINLAVVRTDQLTPAESNEVTKATIHGCIDDICEMNEPIELCDILEPEGKGTLRRVLIEGAPGIGKSTLAWIVCRKWGKCKLFHEYQLVVLLRFRDKSVQDARDVNDLFCYPLDSDTQRNIVKEIRRSNGQGLLLIFEGYDQLPVPKRRSDSVFHNIITGYDLPSATVIITTRPTASTELRSICAGKTSRHIEILGFGTTEINSCIQSSIPNKETRADFNQYLTLHPYIHKMMYVPLNCAIVVQVYQSSKRRDAPAPKTITHLYTALIIALLQRYLNNHEVYQHEHIVLHNFKSLQRIEPVHEQFLQICQLAYQGIVKSETELVFHDLPNDFDSLSLMRSANELYVNPIVSHYGAYSSHNFLHLTIQEYLAAFHIAQWDTQAQIAFLERHIDSKKMLTVLAFVSGLTVTGMSLWNAVGSFAQHRKMDAASLENTHCIKLPVLQWLFESQDPVACDTVFGSTKPVGFRYDGPAHPFHFFVLGYCIANSRCSWELHIRLPTGTEWVKMLLKGLTCKIDTSSSSRAKGIKAVNISHCELPSEVFELLRSIPTHLLENVTHLILHATSITPDGIELLAELLNLLPNLQRLVVRHTKLSHGGAVKLIRCLDKLSNLREVVMKNVDIGLEDYKAVGDLLRMSRSIKMLDLGNNPCSCEAPHSISQILDGIAHNTSLVAVTFPESVLTTQDAISLAKTLKSSTTLRKLCISYCKMALCDAIYLIKALKIVAFEQLHSLYMAGCNIQDKGATSLAKAVLSKGSVLEVLDLSENSIGVEGASAIAENLRENTCLKDLYLANNQFGSKGAICLANSLERNHKIEILKLSRNSFESADNFRTFTDTVTKCTSLHNLYLDYCDIQTDDVVHLAEILEVNSTLKVVSLSGNPVGVLGAAAFAQTLRNNTSLLELWLDDKSIGTEGARILITVCSTATNLKDLYLLDECKPEHFNHLQRTRVAFLPKYDDKHLIPPIALLFTSNRYYFTPVNFSRVTSHPGGGRRESNTSQKSHLTSHVSPTTTGSAPTSPPQESDREPPDLHQVPPGIGFLGEPFRVVVGHEGRTVILQKHGISFTIPKDAVSKEKEATIQGQACVGPFVTPEGYELASPVYLISTSCKFQKKIEATISHFAYFQSKEDCSDMLFAMAPSTPSYSEDSRQKPMYIFKAIESGAYNFYPYMQKACVTLDHFCFCCCMRRKHIGKLYTAMFWAPKEPLQPTQFAVFGICLFQYERSLEDRLKEANFPDKFLVTSKRVHFEMDSPSAAVELIIPHDEIKKQRYKVETDFGYQPKIAKSDVDVPSEYQEFAAATSISYPPRVILTISAIEEDGGPSQPLGCTLTVRGAKESTGDVCTFFLRLPHVLFPMVQSPSQSTISKPSSRELMFCLYKTVAAEWSVIGTFIGVSRDQLRIIGDRHLRDPQKCLLDMLDCWLECTDPPPTWDDIASAVEFIGKQELAQEIRRKHCH